MGMDPQLRYLLDRIEIQDVIARYGLGQDLHQPDGEPSPLDQWKDVFSEDAVIDYSEVGFPESITREQLTVMMRGEDLKTGGMTPHFTSWQHLEAWANVTIDGDTATAITPHMHTHPTRDGEGNTFAAGLWHDKLERRPEGWRIVHRYLQDLYVTTFKLVPMDIQL